jgi:choline-sulfatase
MMDENAQLPNRHPGEGRGPVSSPDPDPDQDGNGDWIPAFAGMTVERSWPTKEFCGPAHFQSRGPKALLFLLVLLWVLPLQAEPARDLVLVTIDTWRHDAVPWASGAMRVPAPALEKVAASGRRFERAYAHNTVTLPSHLNMLTGLYPFQHGVRDNAGFLLPPKIDTMATLLAERGFATGAFVSALTLDARFGLGRGFEVYDQPRGRKQGRQVFEVSERPAPEAIDAALAWWQKEKGRRRFLWLHLFDPHAPYEPPEPWRSRFAADPYRGEVAAVDSFLARLLDPLDKQNVLLAITADHGEGLGEHGEETHGDYAWDSTLRVPLLLWGSGALPGVDRRLARHVDLLPTFLEAAGAPPASQTAGISLLGPADPGASSYFEALSGHFNLGWAPLRGILDARFKAYEKPLPELYDLEADPGETRNLEGSQRRELNRLRRLLPAESGWPPSRETVVSPEVAATLKSLGYLSDSAPRVPVAGPADDPHALVELTRKLHQAERFFSAGRYPEAIAAADAVLARRPTVPIAYTVKTQALLALGKNREALAAIEAAQANKSAGRELVAQLGLTLIELDRPGEAVTRLEKLAGQNPGIRGVLASALAAAGRAEEGRKILLELVAANPGDGEAFERLSAVALELGRPQEALNAARQATQLEPRRAWAWNNLGVALSLLGQRNEALPAWERAVEEDPELWDTWYNLGMEAASLGDLPRARRALQKFTSGAPRQKYAADVERARRQLDKILAPRP